MIADRLTKVMNPQKLFNAPNCNYWEIKQLLKAVIKKKAKQVARRKKHLLRKTISSKMKAMESTLIII